MSAQLLLLVLVTVAAAAAALDDEGYEDLRIDVVEQDPGAGVLLAAAATAGLRAGGGRGGRAEAAHAEFAEPLALGARACAAAAAGAAGVLSAARAPQPAAARAGAPLLLVGPPDGDAARDALALYPDDDIIAEVCAAIISEKGWSSAVVLHEGGVRPALAAGGAARAAGGAALAARRLPPAGDPALLRNLLLVLKREGAVNFVVWCSARCARRVLAAAQRVGLLADRHSYIFSSLELHTEELSEFSYGGANVTVLMLFDVTARAVRVALRAVAREYERRVGAPGAPGAERWRAAPPSSLVLAYDAGLVLGRAAAALRLPPRRRADCDQGRAAFHADTLINYIRSREWEDTVSGVAAWDGTGRRRGVSLRVLELARGGQLARAGVWAAPRVHWRRAPRPAPPLAANSMTNRTFTVLIAEIEPYVMKQESMERLTGNARYEGFCIELIERLAQQLGFNYTFEPIGGNDYGKRNPSTNEWSGMIRRVREDWNTFAITDLTITEEREQAVDFTTPFMNLGISILFRKPDPPEPELFAFMLPFSRGVWICLGIAYLGTSLLLYVVGRLCPEEWQNPYPCVEDPPALQNQFTLANALWFNLGAVLLQGSEIAPVAYGTRAVASVWWLFALVITSSYTANLATLLAKKSPSETIRDVHELYNSPDIDYGAKAGGATYMFFKHSVNESTMYRDMYLHMSERQMPTDNNIGIKKVVDSKGKYAFFMESTSIEYTVERNCDVMKVGDLLDSKGYGIAMRKESPYRQELNLALLKLQEAGVLREMKETWWREKHGGGACKPVDDRESSELSMRNFLGLFLVLAVGCALGALVSLGDLAVRAARRPRQPDLPYSANLAAELRFVFRFERNVKPLQGPLSEPASERTESGSGEGEGSGGAGSAGEGEAGSPRTLSPVGSARRRRSSMHAASVRLARHAAR